MLSPDGAVRLIRRHQARLEQFVAGSERRATGAWVATRGGSEFPRLAAQIATALRTTVANQTAATLTTYLRLAETEALPSVNTRELAASIRNGVDPTETYAQPARAGVWALDNGRSPIEADRLARSRVTELVATDAALAAQRVEHAIVTAAAGAVTAWRRVPDPKACLLCLSASQQLYRTSHLRGIHEHCKCGTAPVTLRFDPQRAVAGIVVAQFAAAGREPTDQLHAEVTDSEFGIRLRNVSR